MRHLGRYYELSGLRAVYIRSWWLWTQPGPDRDIHGQDLRARLCQGESPVRADPHKWSRAEGPDPKRLT